MNHLSEQIEYSEMHTAWLAAGAPDGKEPWREWEISVRIDEWYQMAKIPDWDKDCEYRRKPRMLTVAAHEVPMPETVAPAYGTTYYVAHSELKDFFEYYYWHEDASDLAVLAARLVYLTKEDAIAAAKAGILARGGSVDD